MTDPDREDRVTALLGHNIRLELRSMNAMLDLQISEDSIDTLAEAVTASILYAFTVDWGPDWVKPGDVHAWNEEGDWFARCPTCLTDSPAATTRHGAVLWAHQHEAGHTHIP